MANLNKVMLIGNLTRDVELTYTPKGMAVGKFGLAVNRRYKSDTGEQKEETTFVDITLWGKTAELANQYLSKGRSAYVEGRLQLDSWDDKQTGQKRSKLYVTGEVIQFLGARGEGSGNSESSSTSDEYDQRPAPKSSSPGGSYAGGSGGNQQRPKPKPAPTPPQDDDDDIPF